MTKVHFQIHTDIYLTGRLVFLQGLDNIFGTSQHSPLIQM